MKPLFLLSFLKIFKSDKKVKVKNMNMKNGNNFIAYFSRKITWNILAWQKKWSHIIDRINVVNIFKAWQLIKRILSLPLSLSCEKSGERREQGESQKLTSLFFHHLVTSTWIPKNDVQTLLESKDSIKRKGIWYLFKFNFCYHVFIFKL